MPFIGRNKPQKYHKKTEFFQLFLYLNLHSYAGFIHQVSTTATTFSAADSADKVVANPNCRIGRAD
jgi:hypothetical protein